MAKTQRAVDLSHLKSVLSGVQTKLSRGHSGPGIPVMGFDQTDRLLTITLSNHARIEVKEWMGSITVAHIYQDQTRRETYYVSKEGQPSSKPVRWGFQKYDVIEAVDRLVWAVEACPLPRHTRRGGTMSNCDKCAMQMNCLATAAGDK